MYLALYRKWRPKTFEDVVSQEHIITTLKNEVANQKTAHAYLFTGSRGTGKTTCSKILAMAINCPHSKDGNPCMECNICKGIEDGSILDVVEMDAASNNGVDDVRMLREEANYTPAQCKYRVYIVDEAHMLSPSAFNALLKIMEEPPAHVKFILATTEVHKIPATILSRCQRFDFIRIKTEDIAKRLLYIADHENFTLTSDAAFLIAKLADGGMRDALSTLDQCTSFADNVDVSIVSEATGIALREYLLNVVDMICKKDVSKAIEQVNYLYQNSKDLQRLVIELIEYFRNIMIVKTVSNVDDLIKSLPDEIEIMKNQSKLMSLSSVLRVIRILQECLDSMSKSKNKRLNLEMCFIKLCKPELDYSKEALIERLETLETQLSTLSKGGGISVSGVIVSDTQQTVGEGLPLPITKANHQTECQPTQQTKAYHEHGTPNGTENPSPTTNQIQQQQSVGEGLPLPITKAINQTECQNAQQTPTTSSDIEVFDKWEDILILLQKKDPMLYGVLENSKAFTKGDFLFIQSPFEFFADMIKKDGMLKKLLLVVFEQTGTKYRIRIKKNKVEEQQISPLKQLVTDASQLGLSVYDKNSD